MLGFVSPRVTRIMLKKVTTVRYRSMKSGNGPTGRPADAVATAGPAVAIANCAAEMGGG